MTMEDLILGVVFCVGVAYPLMGLVQWARNEGYSEAMIEMESAKDEEDEGC
jgi:hypothetical protein